MKDKFYYPELDGLRFLAFLAVFIHHGPNLPGIPGYTQVVAYGWIGVDLFLCLSAFLFVHLLRMEWEKSGTINVWFFYLRRSLRIWPIYLIFVLFLAIINVQEQGLQPAFPLRILGLLTFTDNILSATHGYNPLLWVAHLWTISYEEQFYAFIPWFLRYVFRQLKQKQFLILGILFVLGLSTRALFVALQIPHPAIWVLPITHFESILFGLAIGLGLFDEIFKRVPAGILAVAGIIALYLCTRFPNVSIIDWPVMGLYLMVGLAVSFLVYATMRAQNHPATTWLTWRPLTFLGKVSYGLYLFHYLTLDVVTRWVGSTFADLGRAPQAYLIFVVALALTIFMAAASYRFIEKPFLRMKSRFTVVESRPI